MIQIIKCIGLIILILMVSEARLFKRPWDEKNLHIEKEDGKISEKSHKTNGQVDQTKRQAHYTPQMQSGQVVHHNYYDPLQSSNNLNYLTHLQPQSQPQLHSVNNLYYATQVQSQLQPQLHGVNSFHYTTQSESQLPITNNMRYTMQLQPQLQPQLLQKPEQKVLHELMKQASKQLHSHGFKTNVDMIKSGLDPTWKYDGKKSMDSNSLLGGIYSNANTNLYLSNNHNTVQNGGLANMKTNSLPSPLSISSHGTIYSSNGLQTGNVPTGSTAQYILDVLYS